MTFDPANPNPVNPVPGMVRPADTLAELARQLKALEADDPAQTLAYLERHRLKGEILLRIKKSLPPGTRFGVWIKANLPYSVRLAQDYMLLAKEWPRVEQMAKTQRVAFLSLRNVLAMLAGERKKRRERKLQRDLEAREAAEDLTHPGADNAPAAFSDPKTLDDLLAHEDVPPHQRGDAWLEDDARLYPTDAPDAVDAPVPPEQPPKVTPPDGNGQYPGTPKKPDKLCDRCSRVGWRAGCKDCKEINAKPTPPPKAKVVEDDAPKDLYGQTIPEGCRDLIGDPFLPTVLADFARWSEEMRMSFHFDGFEKRRKRLPHLGIDDLKGAIHTAWNALDRAVEHLQNERPIAVCPKCRGEGCGEDHHTGVVGKKEYEKLTAKGGGK
jgi:hypothetical protein